MVDLSDLQKRIYENKARRGWNVTDIKEEIVNLVTEVGEMYKAYCSGTKEELSEELADIAIYVLGIAEMNGIDLGTAIESKVAKNERRIYWQDEEGRWHKKEGEDSSK